MQSRQVFEDLFAYGNRSLGWMRVHMRANEGITLVVEPQDNPGASAVNAASQLWEAISRAFPGLESLRVFVRFPDDPRQKGWIELIPRPSNVEFGRHSIEEIKELLGEEVFDPPEDACCASLGGHDHPLLALIPPEDPPRNRIAEMAIVAVADLPWPHEPSVCRWKPRFDQILEQYPVKRDRAAVGAHWFLTLSEEDCSGCSYHQADWEQIAGTSVEVFRSLDSEAELDDAVAAVEEALGDSVEGSWCRSLFVDPISWYPGERSVGNGQHRSCALRASGAPLCVVDVEGAWVDEPVAGDPRRLAAAEVASFWAWQAAQ
jgi:hypothetical protein